MLEFMHTTAALALYRKTMAQDYPWSPNNAQHLMYREDAVKS